MVNILEKVVDKFKNISGKVVEKLKNIGEEVVDNLAEEWTGQTITLNSNLQSLKKNCQALESKASVIAEWSSEKKSEREAENWLKEVEEIMSEFSQLEGVNKRWRSLRNQMTRGDVEKMEKRVTALLEQSQQFNGLLHDDHGNEWELRLTAELVGKEFENNLKSIKQWLETDVISSIGIYGMGGVGKNTLAKQANNYHSNFRFLN